MGIAFHTVYAPDGASVNLFDRVVVGTVAGTYGTGASAGASVTMALTWGEPIKTPYNAIVTPIEDSTYFVTLATTTGCSVVFQPRLATNTLAGGSVSLLLIS